MKLFLETVKKVLLKKLQISQKNNSVEVSF